MSIITSEMAARAVGSIYDLVLISSRRVRELRSGHAPSVSVDKNFTEISVALQEIEQGFVGKDYLLKHPEVHPIKKSKASR